MSINDDLDDLYSRNKGLEAQVLRLEAKLKDFDTRIQQMDDKSRAQLNWWLSPK
jgi:predicted  nucleic acid-binding Zn-ribbon protein